MTGSLPRTVADCRDIPIVRTRGRGRARTCSVVQCHCRDSPQQWPPGGGPIGTSSPVAAAKATRGSRGLLDSFFLSAGMLARRAWL